MPFKRGFIAPPWPHTRGDSVSAACLIERAEKNAARGCGLHDEIYHYRAVNELADVLERLSAGDAAIFQAAAASRGFRLDESALQNAYQAYQNKLSKIRRES